MDEYTFDATVFRAAGQSSVAPKSKMQCDISRLLFLSQKAALEHTKTAVDGQQAWTCMRGNNPPYHQLVIVRIHHSKGKSETGKYTHYCYDETEFAYHNIATSVF